LSLFWHKRRYNYNDNDNVNKSYDNNSNSNVMMVEHTKQQLAPTVDVLSSTSSPTTNETQWSEAVSWHPLMIAIDDG
jgi:hypothetical protein